jgi:outer membrane protein
MKTYIRLVFALSIVTLVLSSQFCWAAGTKFGYFDVRAVQSKSKWGEMVKQELKNQKDKLQVEIEQKTKAFKEKRDEFDKKKAVLDEKARNKQTQELQTMQQEAEKLIMESQSQLNQLQEKLIPPLNDKILEVVKQIGKKDNYDYIFDKAAVGYASEKDDITSRVITELDKVTPASIK